MGMKGMPAGVPGGDHETRGHPLHVVFERSGRVSSKSLRSNSNRRSGEANAPKSTGARPRRAGLQP
jgi:hypothetical protein